jgi:hypothetical protein
MYVFFITTQFYFNVLQYLQTFRTQDDLNIIYPIFVATSTLPQCILYSDRIIAAPVDNENILKMERASDIPLATTFKFVDADDADNNDAGAGTGARTGPHALPTPPPVTVGGSS